MFSPTDLNHFLECEHLIQIERARDRTVPRPTRDAHAELLATKGAEHEAARLKQFRAEGREVVEFENRYLCRDGSARWLQWSSRPVPDHFFGGVARVCPRLG